ncbi:arsenate reductase ArsC [Streptomyces sp. YIM 98790]|uniref:arsenate reductase ArsC n=1 Tax=Streptomyces sp. YIM 98790 TaxID=2689077 RepID=UPI00140B096B|nr:arsenate reductase ArsC [Streptomyces sp. YIM 98790]
MTALSSPAPSEERFREIAGRLAARHKGRFSRETVQQVLADSYTLLAATATVPTYLLVLAERFTRERLTALAHLETPATGTPRVLFVCTRNAGRSQMAAALLAHRAGERLQVSSAGTRPAAGLDPGVAAVLAEQDVALADAYPKPLTDEVVRAADIVITMGCGDACPVIPGRRYLDWPLPDPDGAPLDAVRAVRNDIDARITELLALLPPAS